MKYHWISKNIIGCHNFLPPLILQNIKIDLLNSRTKFSVPSWGDKDDKVSQLQFYSENCGSFDYWIDHNEFPAETPNITKLGDWFYHRGLENFIAETDRNSVFKFLEMKIKKHDIHVCAYNHGGYYGWHMDNLPFFIFNLFLNEGDNLEGGDMLFMDDGKIIEIPNINNYMVVFPSYISHSIKIIKSKNGKDVPFPQQRFSIQYWTKCS